MDEHKEIILKEYAELHQDIQHRESHYWIIAGIFLTGNITTLGIIIGAIISGNLKFRIDTLSILTLAFIYALGIGLIFITRALVHNANRSNFIIYSNYDRMREIEDELGMWANWRIHGLDNWFSEGKKFDESLSNEMTTKLLKYKDQSWWQQWREGKRYAGPNRAANSKRMMNIITYLWIFVMALVGVAFIAALLVRLTSVSC